MGLASASLPSYTYHQPPSQIPYRVTPSKEGGSQRLAEEIQCSWCRNGLFEEDPCPLVLSGHITPTQASTQALDFDAAIKIKNIWLHIARLAGQQEPWICVYSSLPRAKIIDVECTTLLVLPRRWEQN